jgi:hypothetical protein
MNKTQLLCGAIALVLVSGCAEQPTGPIVAVMPGHGKSMADFQKDDYDCRGFASDRVAGRAESANDRAILSAIIGAGLGAALGGAAGGGTGAGIGAAAGGLAGTAVGSHQSTNKQYDIQRQYDVAYSQCMAARGNNAPQIGGDYGPQRNYDYGTPPPPPPPPPGS